MKGIENKHIKTTNLFGETIESYVPIKDRWGIYPLSIWELPNNKRLQELKKLVQDNIGGVQYGNWDTISEFSPLLAELIVTGYTLYKPSNILDPFAGRGTRGIIAGLNGHNYLGVDINEKYIEANNERAKYHKLQNIVHFITGDSRNLVQLTDVAYADLIYTCPPYFNLEQYHAGDKDLSMINNYSKFLEELNKIIEQCYLALKTNGFCIWVIGTIRKESHLIDLRGDVVRLFIKAGFTFFDDIVFHYTGGLKMLRLGTFDKSRITTKSHEYVLVFTKPTRGAF